MTHVSTRSETNLLALSACEMARQIATGNISSVELVEAHIRRIEAVNPLLNAVVVKRFNEARAEAAAADRARANGERLGPLHGVPVTIKECFHVAGTPSTEGIGRFAEELLTEDNPLVERLRRAGAIVLGKTNVPQLLVLHESDNPVYGRTNNPWNLDRGPGGSSGGEAAIVAAGGSPLGLGNDIGGSIRFPAHSCGVCGIKPTTLRLTNRAVRDNLHGMEAIRSQSGPIARSVDDLTLALRILNQRGPGDIEPDTAPVPLGDPADIHIENLRIGMWTDDGFYSPAPALRRAVREAADALRQLGARVEPFTPPDMEEAVRLFYGLVSADGAANALSLLGNSTRDWQVRRLVLLSRLPAPIRHPLKWLTGAIGQRHRAWLLDALGRRSADEYWQLCYRRSAYAERFLAAWSQARLDAVICPPHSLPALRHGTSGDLSMTASYCFWVNVLGLPAGIVPATRVRPGEETDRAVGRDLVDRTAQAVEMGSAGLPVGVQVAAPPWREETVLAVMGALESHFRGQPDFPHTPVDPPADFP